MNPRDYLSDQITAAGLWEKTIQLKRYDFLISKGDLDTNLYLVQEGSFRIFITEETTEHTIRFGYQGDLITALDSFITDKPTSFFFQALRKSIIKRIPKARFEEFINSSDDLKNRWYQGWKGMVYEHMEREQDLLTTSPLERYQRVLARSPRLFQEIPNKYIASYLRMTPETLSRIMKS